MRIPKKYEPMIELAEHDEDGWWIYLNYGWCWSCTGLHIIHEDTQKQALECLKKINRCNCSECAKSIFDAIDNNTKRRIEKEMNVNGI